MVEWPDVVVVVAEGATEALPAGVVALPAGYGAGAEVVAAVVAGVVAREAEDALDDWVEVEAERVALPDDTPPTHSTASSQTWEQTEPMSALYRFEKSPLMQE